MDECIQKLVSISSSRKCKHRNNGAGRARQHPEQVLRRSKKKRDEDYYEPESLKIMQSAIERYLKEMNYPLSIVRSREFHNSQEILHAKAISLRQQGKGKRPNKSQPLTSEEESSLWLKGQPGDFNDFKS